MAHPWSLKALIYSEHETGASVGENGHFKPETRRSGAFPPPEWHIFTGGGPFHMVGHLIMLTGLSI